MRRLLRRVLVAAVGGRLLGRRPLLLFAVAVLAVAAGVGLYAAALALWSAVLAGLAALPWWGYVWAALAVSVTVAVVRVCTFRTHFWARLASYRRRVLTVLFAVSGLVLVASSAFASAGR